jgi:subtilisin
MQSLPRLWALALALNLALLQMTIGVGAAPESQGRPDAPDSESVPGQQISAQAIPERYIVVFKPDVADPRQAANENARQHGLTVSHVYQHALKGYAARIPAARLDAVRADPRVLLVSEDREVKAFTHEATHLDEVPTGVRRIDLADPSVSDQRLPNDGAGVAVAVLDTGIDLTHPDLAPNINTALGTSCIPGASTPNDDNGHGTHVAGTIAARDNGTGVVGVAPLATLVPVKVLDSAGSGSWTSIICGIDHVTGQAPAKGGPIKVANMSLGGGGPDSACGADALHLAICNSVNAGVLYVVAAGNDGRDFGVASGFFRPQTVPAVYDEVLTVTAMADFNGEGPVSGRAPAPRACRREVDDTAADFSNFTTIGSPEAGHVIAAPGACILSTWKGGTYHTISGTSMATPHVAGVAALCIAGPCAGMAPSAVMARLRDDAAARPAAYGFTDDPRSPSGNRHYGYLVYPGGY